MSLLIKNGAVAPDPYAAVADDAPLPAEGPLRLTLARWEQEAATIGARPIAVQIPNTADVGALGPKLKHVASVILEFPGFADGRAYSQARMLRDTLGYGGEIRATGKAVVRDQLHGMLRCGIDAFEPREDQPPASFLSALADFTLAYQPGADRLPRVPVLRRGPDGMRQS